MSRFERMDRMTDQLDKIQGSLGNVRECARHPKTQEQRIQRCLTRLHWIRYGFWVRKFNNGKLACPADVFNL